MTGVDIGFETSGIQDGAAIAAAVAEAATPVVDRLAGMVIAPGPFGQVALAEPLCSALLAARDGFRELAKRVGQQHADLSERARSTAGLGAQLVADTTDAAVIEPSTR